MQRNYASKFYSVHLHPFFVYKRGRGSGKSAHMHKCLVTIDHGDVYSGTTRLDFALFIYIHSLCFRAAKALASLRICTNVLLQTAMVMYTAGLHASISLCSSTSILCVSERQRLWQVCAYAQMSCYKRPWCCIQRNYTSKFCSVNLHPFFVYKRGRGSGKSAHMHKCHWYPGSGVVLDCIDS